MKKLTVLSLLLILLTVFSVNAVVVTYRVIQGDVLPGDSPEYILEINNNKESNLIATLKSADLNWVLNQENQRFSIPENSKKEITITYSVGTINEISPGNYGVVLVVETDNGDRFEKILPINVIAFNKVVEPAFKPSGLIDPKRGGILKLNLENKYRINLENLKLELESPHFSTLKDIDIGSEETKIIEIPVKLPKDTQEANYNVHVSLKQGDKVLLDKFLSYKVAAYEDVRELIEPEERFLYGGERITKTNMGNSEVIEFYTKKFSSISYLLASFDPEPTKVEKEGGSNVVTWEFSLRPEQKKIISYAVNYRTPTLILILIILILGVYHVFRKKNAIVITKKALAMHGNEGSVHVLKVIINVRNRGNFTVNNVRVLDKVPDAIKAPTQYSSLRPKEVKAQPGFTSMVWDIDSIKPGHERVLSYMLTGKMEVLGKMMLPQARAKYAFMGRHILTSSFTVSLKGKKETL